jgi:phenylacetate-coenzyme A ligase PaaK-like adenylate-forming protein
MDPLPEVPAFDARLAPFAAWQVSAASWASPLALQALQEERRIALFEAAVAGSRWVREAFAGRDPGSVALHELPVMRKAELMQRFDDWVTDPRVRLADLRRFVANPDLIGSAYAGDFVAWESSGSSGEPMLFVQDAGAMAVYDALEAMRRPVLRPLRRWLDPAGLAERHAFVGAIGGHFASTVSIERLRRLSLAWRHALQSFSFLQPVDDLVAQLNRYRPTVLATYPTAALLLAEQAVAGRLRIDLNEIWTGGEALSHATRRYVEQAFGCPVAHSYGASEFLPLASECSRRALHLNSDWVLLEPVDVHGRPVAPGEPCHTTLLTNLANRVQPLIRCDIGDRVTFAAERCACGSPLPVIEVEGRTDDALLLRDASGHPVRLLPLALTTVLEEEAGLFVFQIRQLGERELLLRLPPADAPAAAVLKRARDALAGFLRLHGLADVRVDIRCDEPFVPSRSGKAARVVGQAERAPG